MNTNTKTTGPTPGSSTGDVEFYCNPATGQTLPPGWRSQRLKELLDGRQLVAVQAILHAHGDPFEALPTLRAYLDGFKDELLVKGIVSDYLAYAIVMGVVNQRMGEEHPAQPAPEGGAQ